MLEARGARQQRAAMQQRTGERGAAECVARCVEQRLLGHSATFLLLLLLLAVVVIHSLIPLAPPPHHHLALPRLSLRSLPLPTLVLTMDGAIQAPAGVEPAGTSASSRFSLCALGTQLTALASRLLLARGLGLRRCPQCTPAVSVSRSPSPRALRTVPPLCTRTSSSVRRRLVAVIIHHHHSSLTIQHSSFLICVVVTACLVLTLVVHRARCWRRRGRCHRGAGRRADQPRAEARGARRRACSARLQGQPVDLPPAAGAREAPQPKGWCGHEVLPAAAPPPPVDVAAT